MTIEVIIYCMWYSGLLIIGKAGVFLHFRKKQSKKEKKDTISLSDITLIVPFRNEANRIAPLLNSIAYSKELPAHILFVDDHSDDHTGIVIEEKLKNIQYQLISSIEAGKKGAIKMGIEMAVTPYILTMDADVTFPSTYFSCLQSLSESDMHILPVKMASRGWKIVFELDVYMVNGLNLIADGIKRPIVASGANLLFKREIYNQISTHSAHSSVLSGDDQFLLADFNNNGRTVSLQTNANLAVITPVPDSISDFISQRLRWIAKTPKVKDSFALKIGIIQLLTTIGFLVLSFSVLMKSQFMLFFVLLAVKSTIDILLVQPYFTAIKKQGFLFLIPVYEIIFPIYTITLSIMALFHKPNWKGRR